MRVLAAEVVEGMPFRQFGLACGRGRHFTLNMEEKTE